MMTPAKLGLRIVLGAMLITACSRPSRLVFEVESLHQRVPELMQAAKAWRPDAYLETASVRIVGEQTPSYLLSSHFISPSEDFDSLAVRILADGSASVDPLTQTIAIEHVDPIIESDWTLDSPAAFEIALDDEGRQFLEELESTSCSLLILERASQSPGAPVVWRLLLLKCDTPLVGQTTVIDATTGELISRESHLPTAAP